MAAVTDPIIDLLKEALVKLITWIDGGGDSEVTQSDRTLLNAQVYRIDADALPPSAVTCLTKAITSVSSEFAAPLAAGEYLAWSDVPAAIKVAAAGATADIDDDIKVTPGMLTKFVVTSAQVTASENYLTAVTSGGNTTMNVRPLQ